LTRRFAILWWLALVALTGALVLEGLHRMPPGPDRLPAALERAVQPTARMTACADIPDAATRSMHWFCIVNPAAQKQLSFAVIGDSHAAALVHAFDSAAINTRQSGMLSSQSACPPLLGVYLTSRLRPVVQKCTELNQRLFAYIRDKRIRKVFLVAKWSYYTEPWEGRYASTLGLSVDEKPSPEGTRIAFEEGVRRTAEAYRELGIETVFVEQAPQQLAGPRTLYASAAGTPDELMDRLRALSVPRVEHERQQAFVRQVFTRQGMAGARVAQFDDVLCDETVCMAGDARHPFYQDRSHLSRLGAERLVPRLRELLAEGVRR
jgi:hypothetical protein